ncbi:alpha/beta hydrolase fold domain-containing protein [Rhizobium pisi]|uniref:alpha/beta hydrolase fold domain-containing protein n=1 Tax=Rhizobium pisi TaxID=574561 RepID=UPI001FDFAE5C|nr:alpha/beta hydrolase fold domain-containing protein [Rhizobium pisi]
MKIVQTVIAGAVAAAVANVALAARSPGVERNTQGFLEAMAKAGAPPLESLSPADARAAVAAAQAGAKLAPADISEKTISVDGKPLKLTIVRPLAPMACCRVSCSSTVEAGSSATSRRTSGSSATLVADSGAAAIFVNYTLSPEVRYPVAINEAYAATKWVAREWRTDQRRWQAASCCR